MTNPLLLSELKSLAIVGTAGRGSDASKLQLEHFEKMCNIARGIVEHHKITHLVSGGAPWADHVAVRLFIGDAVSKLTLHFPSKFIEGQFEDTGVFDWRTNPGGTANYYHNKFCCRTGIYSLEDIDLALQKGAQYTVNAGFHERNKLVAQSDMLLAFTFGEEARVKDGGTAHTVKEWILFHPDHPIMYLIHVDLNTFKEYRPAII